MIQATQQLLSQGTPSVAAAHALLLKDSQDSTATLQTRLEKDERSCDLWLKGIADVRRQDWQSAKVAP